CSKPGVTRMCKKYSNSAQCAWLFGHAHLTGEASIKIKYGVQIYFSALSLVFATSATSFFARVVVFLTALAIGLAFVVFLTGLFTARFVFPANSFCCLARSSRTNSSW